MSNLKKQFKKGGRYVWEMVKAAIPALFMYLCAGTILMMIIFSDVKEGEMVKWSSADQVWTVVCIVLAAAYNALISYAHGGMHYEMLVTGNVKRATQDAYGNEYKMSSHKYAKEYRVWKGFVVGGVISLVTIIIGIVFGCNQAKIDGKLSGTAVVGFMLSGWSVLPLYGANVATGAGISYFLSLLFALIPIGVTGGFYIVGAYARRNKNLRQQLIADKQAEKEAQKGKKINYGALPGTKPKKRK